MKLQIKVKKNIALIASILLGLVPLIWLLGKPYYLINGVDTNFPLDPLVWFQRRFYIWNNIANGGFDFSGSTAGIFFHLIQVVPYTLGASLHFTQLTSLIFWYVLITISAYIFSRQLFKSNNIARILFVVFYSFNIYLFNSWENVKVTNLSLIAVIPLGLTILIKINEGTLRYAKAILLSVLVGIIASGTGINPAYFLAFISTLIIFQVPFVLFENSLKSRIEMTRNLLIIILPVVLVNSFWLFPTANFVFQNISLSNSIADLGFTSWIDSLSANTSLVNVMRGLGAWDWYTFDQTTGLPIYIPYALRFMKDPVFILFSFAIPCLVFLSFVMRKSIQNVYGKYYASFGILLVIGVFLGTGTHAPTGQVFAWMIRHVPFFSLFRSPWYIFSPFVILAYAGLIALLHESLLDRLKRSPSLKKLLVLLNLSALIFVAGNLVYSYPLVTGKIFRPNRADSFYISFPSYVFDASNWLREKPEGRVVGYPDDEIENFAWGYRGIESILSLVSNRETLFSPLNTPNSGIALLLREFYSAVKKGETSAADNLAAKLQVRYLFEKKDQQSITPVLPTTWTPRLSSQFGEWIFYELPIENTLPKIFSASQLMFSYPKPGVESVKAALTDMHIVNPADSIVNQIPKVGEIIGKSVLAENSQKIAYDSFSTSVSRLTNRLLTRDLSRVTYSFVIPQEGEYKPTLERYKVEEFGINPRGKLEVRQGDRTIDLEVDRLTDSYIIYKPVFFDVGPQSIEITLRNENILPEGNFESGERYRKGGYGEGQSVYTLVTEAGNTYLSIYNIAKADVTADFTLKSFDPFIPYFAQFRYKQIYGNNGLAFINQQTSNTLVKSQTERLPNYPEWNDFSFYYEPVKTNSNLTISLSAPFTIDPLGTKMFYDDLSVYKVFMNSLLLVDQKDPSLSVPKVTYEYISPVKYKVKVTEAKGPHVIIFSENYSNGWRFTSPRINAKHFAVNLYANAWYVRDSPTEYEAEIYYEYQNLFTTGIAIALGSLITAIVIYLFSRK